MPYAVFPTLSVIMTFPREATLFPSKSARKVSFSSWMMARPFVFIVNEGCPFSSPAAEAAGIVAVICGLFDLYVVAFEGFVIHRWNTVVVINFFSYRLIVDRTPIFIVILGL